MRTREINPSNGVVRISVTTQSFPRVEPSETRGRKRPPSSSRQMDEEISSPLNKTRQMYFDLTEECVFTCIFLCMVGTRNTRSLIADCEQPVRDIFHTEETCGPNRSSFLFVGKLLVHTQQIIIRTV